MTTKKKPGRPKGSKTQQHPVVEIEKTKCPKCGSTDRDPYLHTTKRELCGQLVIWRKCRCSNCGQIRVDKETQTL